MPSLIKCKTYKKLPFHNTKDATVEGWILSNSRPLRKTVVILEFHSTRHGFPSEERARPHFSWKRPPPGNASLGFVLSTSPTVHPRGLWRPQRLREPKEGYLSSLLQWYCLLPPSSEHWAINIRERKRLTSYLGASVQESSWKEKDNPLKLRWKSCSAELYTVGVGRRKWQGWMASEAVNTNQTDRE